MFGGGFAGQRGTASGIFTDCNGRNTGNNGAGGFVGAVGIASGTFINCIGANSGVNSGGLVGLNATTNGRFINCISNDITLPTLTTSGLSAKPACYVNCLDGSGRLVNGSA